MYGWHCLPVPGRRLPANVIDVIAAAQLLRKAVPGIQAIALVGSWARAAGGPESDVDLVVLTSEPDALLADDATSWFRIFGADVELIRCADFGLLQERRLRRSDGLVVEVAIGAPDWAATDPPDAGSARVVRDGMRILFDPEQLLSGIAKATEAS